MPETDITTIIQQALEDGKGSDITTLAVANQSGGLFDWMIIVTANSPRHAVALSERVRLAVKESGRPQGHSEISDEKAWVLVDSGEAITHIMQPDARILYDLESLWGFEEEQ
ncbi:MAG: ribosome silencing factor [Gammaproteobacteria bacterium WSBS_2016_MAG_OTU1]